MCSTLAEGPHTEKRDYAKEEAAPLLWMIKPETESDRSGRNSDVREGRIARSELVYKMRLGNRHMEVFAGWSALVGWCLCWEADTREEGATPGLYSLGLTVG